MNAAYNILTVPLLTLCLGLGMADVAQGRDEGAAPTTNQSDESICDMPVAYSFRADHKAVLGYLDAKGMVFYRWRGVEVDIKTVPGTLLDGTIERLNTVLDRFRITDIDPPIAYMVVSEKIIAPGYANPHFRVFYQWKDQEMPRNDLPPEAILSDPKADQWRIVVIPKPERKDSATRPASVPDHP